jgi:hypothetical protein
MLQQPVSNKHEENSDIAKTTGNYEILCASNVKLTGRYNFSSLSLIFSFVWIFCCELGNER